MTLERLPWLILVGVAAAALAGGTVVVPGVLELDFERQQCEAQIEEMHPQVIALAELVADLSADGAEPTNVKD